MPSEETKYHVTAERPDSPVTTSGHDHVTVQGSNEEDTIEFYRDVLGMPLVIRQPHLGDPDLTHLFFDTGDGRLLSFFVSDDRPSRTDRSWDSSINVDVGHVQHLAFSLEPEELHNLRETLDDETYDGYDRGIFYALYTRDPNGLVLEFDVDKYEFPVERRGEIVAEAHRNRVDAGDEFIRDEHVESALETLDIEIRPKDVPDAPYGRAFDD